MSVTNASKCADSPSYKYCTPGNLSGSFTLMCFAVCSFSLYNTANFIYTDACSRVSLCMQ